MYFWGQVHCAAARTCSPREKVLAGLSPSSQTVGSLLITPGPAKLARKIKQTVIAANSLRRKNSLDYFWLNWFGTFMVRKSRMLPEMCFIVAYTWACKCPKISKECDIKNYKLIIFSVYTLVTHVQLLHVCSQKCEMWQDKDTVYAMLNAFD